jgi:hypothetical protein
MEGKCSLNGTRFSFHCSKVYCVDFLDNWVSISASGGFE